MSLLTSPNHIRSSAAITSPTATTAQTPSTPPSPDDSNLATIARLYRCFRERDDDGFRALCTPDIAWHQNEGFPNGRHCVGADAIIRDVFDGNLLPWLGFGYTIERMLDAGSHVIVLGHYHGRHRVTGKTMQAAAAHVYELRHGQVCRFQMYADTETIWQAMR